MICHKCDTRVVVEYGAKEGICETCKSPVSLKFTKSGTRYSLVGEHIASDTVVTTLTTAKEKIEAFRRNRDVSNVARKVLGFVSLEASEDFRNLSVKQVREALEQAYELGKQSKR